MFLFGPVVLGGHNTPQNDDIIFYKQPLTKIYRDNEDDLDVLI